MSPISPVTTHKTATPPTSIRFTFPQLSHTQDNRPTPSPQLQRPAVYLQDRGQEVHVQVHHLAENKQIEFSNPYQNPIPTAHINTNVATIVDDLIISASLLSTDLTKEWAGPTGQAIPPQLEPGMAEGLGGGVSTVMTGQQKVNITDTALSEPSTDTKSGGVCFSGSD